MREGQNPRWMLWVSLGEAMELAQDRAEHTHGTCYILKRRIITGEVSYRTSTVKRAGLYRASHAVYPSGAVVPIDEVKT